MKRLRDEVYMNPQFKRPFGSSRGESYGLLHAPGGGDGAGGSGGGVAGAGGSGGGVAGAGGSSGGGATGGTQKLTTNDALTYLKEVKDMFQDQREKYDRFLDVMKDFKAQRVDTTGVIMRVKELFKGHPNLILGFNTFLPRGYEITLTEVEGAPKRTVEFEEAIDFVNKIKSRFQDDDRVYKDFLAILNMYRNEHKGIADVYDEVSVLFSEHPDLLRQFTRFLPDTSTTASTALASFGRHSLHRFDERSSAMPTMRHSHVDKQRLRRDKIIITRGERDLSVERLEVDDDKTVMTSHKDRKKRAERENKDKRNRYQDNRDTDNENNGDISMHRLSDKKKSAPKVDNFGGNSNFVSYDDKDALKSIYSQEFAFCEKVKERLGSADDYQSFLKFLHLYSTEIITKKQLHGLIADLLGKHPDLMEGFKEFFERCERIEGFLAGVMGKKTLWSEGHSSKALRIEDKDREQKREVDGGKEKDRFSSKYLGKSIQELDLSNCQSCTPSYRLLPEDYPIAAASQRSELGAQVLNDHWVSVTSGSEDYSFKHMRRNQYEESLFRCEDDRFELDMLLESVSSAAKRAEELLNSINDNSNNPIRIEEHFTALNLRCIERLYGDHGLDVMDILHKNPSLALPVILSRLKQKQEEWTKCRADFNKVWAEIYAKNHYKSLDHRSFYFKQQDSKNLGTKSLVAEIKEIKEKNENEDHVLLGIAAGNNFSVRPNLEFEYADADIHEDLYEIIKYSSEEICTTKEQSNKVLRFYTTFLEPMLGVQSWRRKSEATEGDGSSKLGTAKNMVTGVTESDGSPNADATTMNLKQPKPNCNGDSNSSPPQVNSCKTGFTNIDTLAKADGSTVASGGQLPNSGSTVTIGPDANHGLAANSSRANNDLGEDSHGSKLNMEDTLCSEGGETSRLNLANGGYVDGSRLAGHDEVFVDAGKVDNGADKISPRGEFEDNIATHQDGGSQSMPEKKRGHDEMHFKTRGHEEISPDAADENDADADDEDSENASEAGEDESAAADGSGEEHEEEEDGEVDGEGEAEDTSDGAFLPHAERFLLICKPLSKYVASPSQGSEGNNHQVFYGNDTFYVLFRLHQTLYERVLSAKVNSASAESKLKTTKDASSDPYTRFKSALFGLLDGSSDNSKFEEDCRSLIGNQSYVLFTLDKLIYKLVKQLQIVSSDEVGYKLLQLYEYEKSRKLHDVDLAYYENVHFILHDENIYRIECTSSPTQLSIQLMDDGNEKSEVVPVSVDPDFADYFYNDYLSATNGRKESSAVVLKRNMRKYANKDESSALHLAMENVLMMNGLECKTSATTSKISYVLDTEDSFIRLGKIRDKSGGKSSLNNQARVQHFHQYLMASVMP